jgi:hypothetical protein
LELYKILVKLMVTRERTEGGGGRGRKLKMCGEKDEEKTKQNKN